ncbi:hypothetical protein, partial [Burkholderia sp. Ac-20345]|uniref:hypothetical protein n=1 Tax=Burkholderia sp. Ac-20345 TaxID=2703891 RepID=UPI00197BC4ED
MTNFAAMVPLSEKSPGPPDWSSLNAIVAANARHTQSDRQESSCDAAIAPLRPASRRYRARAAYPPHPGIAGRRSVPASLKCTVP